MKKTGWAILFFLFAAQINAQETVRVSYEEAKDVFVKNLMDFQGIYGMDISISGNFKGKSYKVIAVHSLNGEETRRELAPEMSFAMSDTLCRFFFMAQVENRDTVRIHCNYRVGTNLYFPIRNAKDYILMETFPEKPYTLESPIPLIAYTTGARVSFNFNGKAVDGVSFCQVRDAHTHPGRWFELFGIKEYIYFQLEFLPE